MRLSELVEREIVAAVTDVEHEAVRLFQRKLRIEVTGQLDEATHAALRGVQRLFGLEAHGLLDKATAAAVDRMTGPADGEAGVTPPPGHPAPGEGDA